MLSKLIRTFLWLLVHISYRIVEILSDLWEYCNLKIAEIKRCKDTEDSVEYVYRSTKCVLKVPQHIALILDEDDASYADLAKILIWSLAAGISYFSFYDKTGSLNRNEDKLFAAVEKLKANVPGHIKWTNYPDLNGFKNGTKHDITVNLVAREDGKEKIVNLIQNMCAETRKGFLNRRDLDVDYIDSRLKDMFLSIPEPNLAIVCGKSCRTNGFLPWHIRLTEFLCLSTHRNIRVEKFIHMLQSYGKCEQRYGK